MTSLFVNHSLFIVSFVSPTWSTLCYSFRSKKIPALSMCGMHWLLYIFTWGAWSSFYRFSWRSSFGLVFRCQLFSQKGVSSFLVFKWVSQGKRIVKRFKLIHMLNLLLLAFLFVLLLCYYCCQIWPKRFGWLKLYVIVAVRHVFYDTLIQFVIHLVIIGVVKEVMFVFGPLLSLFKNSTKLIDIILKLSAVFHINSHIKQNFFVVDLLAFLT